MHDDRRGDRHKATRKNKQGKEGTDKLRVGETSTKAGGKIRTLRLAATRCRKREKVSTKKRKTEGKA